MGNDSSDRDFPIEEIDEMAEKYGYQHPTGVGPIKNWFQEISEKFRNMINRN